MRAKIIDIHPTDAWYEEKDKLIGRTAFFKRGNLHNSIRNGWVAGSVKMNLPERKGFTYTYYYAVKLLPNPFKEG